MQLRRGAFFGLFALPVLLFAAPPDATRLTDGMDPSAKPYEDFYQYANGKWLAGTSIPATAPPSPCLRSSGTTTATSCTRSSKTQPGTTRPPKNGVKAKVGLYGSGMDEKEVDKAGAKPLQEELDRVGAVKDAAGLAEIARLRARA